MSLDRDAQEALRLHNEARDEIREDPRPHLKWDPTLAAEALAHAKQLAQSDSGLVHSWPGSRTKNGKVSGENLAMMSLGSFGLADAAVLWIKEKFLYHGERMGSVGYENWGHYTQIIWPTVAKVGLGLARSRSDATYVVARYDGCQMENETPYNTSLGNIFKNRRWDANRRSGGNQGIPGPQLPTHSEPGPSRRPSEGSRPRLGFGGGLGTLLQGLGNGHVRGHGQQGWTARWNGGKVQVQSMDPRDFQEKIEDLRNRMQDRRDAMQDRRDAMEKKRHMMNERRRRR